MRFILLLIACASGCATAHQMDIETTAFYGGHGPPVVQTTVRQSIRW
jgi:hypothetical protein